MRKNGKKAARIVLISVSVVLIVALAAGFGFVQSKLSKVNYTDGKLAGANSPAALTNSARLLSAVDTSRDAEETYVDEDVINILLLGIDEKEKLEGNTGADNIMVLSINTADNTVRLASISRATVVTVMEGTKAGSDDWLSMCIHSGGADLMVKEVAHYFKLDLSRFAMINYNGFADVIDELGGLKFTLTEREASAVNTKVGRHVVDAGDVTLTGEAAVAYARLGWELDDEWGRTDRNRALFSAIVDELKSSDLTTLNAACDKLLPLISTNMEQSEILSLLTHVPAILNNIVTDGTLSIGQAVFPAEDTYESGESFYNAHYPNVYPDFTENTKLLREFLYGDVDLNTDTTK